MAELTPTESANAKSLRSAASAGFTELVELLIEKAPTDAEKRKLYLNGVDNNGCTALYLAAADGHAEVVDLLADQEVVEVEKKDAKDWTPFRAALSSDHAEAAELLLETGKVTSFKKAEHHGWSALSHASGGGHIHVVKAILSAGTNAPDVNEENGEGFTPLYLASSNGYKRVVQKLLKIPGIDVDKASKVGLTPLYAASSNGHARVVELLIRKQAKKDTQTSEGKTPLDAAVSGGHAAVVNLLLRN